MTKGETMPNEVLEKLINTFKARMKNFGYKPKSKKYLDAQQEFFAGACAGIDTVVGNDISCIPPFVYISIIRGDIIELK